MTFDYERETLTRYRDSEYARRYNQEYTGRGHGLLGFVSQTIGRREQRVIDQMLHEVLDGELAASLLDVPCGTGKLATVIAGKTRRIVAVDVSEEMMLLARDSYENVPGFLGFTVADATALPFEDSHFEVVVCLRLLHRVPRDVRARMIGEFARVSSRVVIFSLGIIDMVQKVRLGVRRVFLPGDPVPVPVWSREVGKLTEEAGLTVIKQEPVLRILSMEHVFVAVKARAGEKGEPETRRLFPCGGERGFVG